MNLFSLVFHVGDALTRCPVEGAVFELAGRCGPALQATRSDARGVCCFDCLAPGQYLMTETIAPPGYRRSTKQFYCTVTPCGQTYISGIPAGQVLVTNLPECPGRMGEEDIVRFTDPSCGRGEPCL